MILADLLGTAGLVMTSAAALAVVLAIALLLIEDIAGRS